MLLPHKPDELKDVLPDDESSCSLNDRTLCPEYLLIVDASSLIAMSSSLVWGLVALAASCGVSKALLLAELLIDNPVPLPDQLDELNEVLLDKSSPSHNDCVLYPELFLVDVVLVDELVLLADKPDELNEVLLNEPSGSSFVWSLAVFCGVSETIRFSLTQTNVFL